MKLKLFIFFGLILAVGLVIAGSGDTVDVPVVTLNYPEQLSTVNTYPGFITFNCSEVIPSNDLDSYLRNVTLYYNWSNVANHSYFNSTNAFATFQINETIEIGNGTANSTAFTPHLFNESGYVTWNCLACNVDGNCSWGATNYSFLINTTADVTAPTPIRIDYPANGSVIIDASNLANISFTVRDDYYIQNITLWSNYSETDLLADNHDIDVNITFSVNETLTNGGETTNFTANTDNITITGNFSNWTLNGDGFYYVRLEVCDYNNNCDYSMNYTFEWDKTAPTTSDIAFVHTTAACDKYIMAWNVSESSNYSVAYGWNESNMDLSASTSVSSNDSMELNLTSLNEWGDTYYVNLSLCDEHGNCNYSGSLDTTTYKSFSKEWGACPGWNAYSLLNTSATLGSILESTNENTITTVSWWNETNQTFINHIAGISSNGAKAISRGDAFMIYINYSDYINLGASTIMNTTFDTAVGTYPVNLSGNSGGNWTNFGLLQDWYMWNISNTLADNYTFISYYNNTAQKYVDNIRGWLWNNDTALETGDAIWVWGNDLNYQWYRNLTQVAE